MGQSEWYQILEGVVDAMKPYARRGIHVNVDFFAGVIYYLNGFPQDLFVPIFAVGRIPGWTIQVVEQLQHNILIRPLLQYTGKHNLEYVPISGRD
jgi:citrate synthase